MLASFRPASQAGSWKRIGSLGKVSEDGEPLFIRATGTRLATPAASTAVSVVTAAAAAALLLLLNSCSDVTQNNRQQRTAQEQNHNNPIHSTSRKHTDPLVNVTA